MKLRDLINLILSETDRLLKEEKAFNHYIVKAFKKSLERMRSTYPSELLDRELDDAMKLAYDIGVSMGIHSALLSLLKIREMCKTVDIGLELLDSIIDYVSLEQKLIALEGIIKKGKEDVPEELKFYIQSCLGTRLAVIEDIIRIVDIVIRLRGIEDDVMKLIETHNKAFRVALDRIKNLLKGNSKLEFNDGVM